MALSPRKPGFTARKEAPMDLEKLVEEATADPTRQPPGYRLVRQRTSSGKIRTITRMTPAMRDIQKGLHAYLKTFFDLHLPQAKRWATNYFDGCSPRKNAKRHQGNRYFYCLDLVDAFGSVRFDDLARALSRDPALYAGEPLPFGANSAEEERILGIKEFLTRYCRAQTGGLAQGLSASPLLFNLALAATDEQIGSYCESRGWTYTRAGDDGCVSGKTKIKKEDRKFIRTQLGNARFTVNHKPGKSSVLDIERGPVMITKTILAKDGVIIGRAGLMRRLTQRFTRLAPLSGRDEYLMSLLRATSPSRRTRGESEQHIFDLYARKKSLNPQGAG